jgi:hypothetical protein
MYELGDLTKEEKAKDVFRLKRIYGHILEREGINLFDYLLCACVIQ